MRRNSIKDKMGDDFFSKMENVFGGNIPVKNNEPKKTSLQKTSPPKDFSTPTSSSTTFQITDSVKNVEVKKENETLQCRDYNSSPISTQQMNIQSSQIPMNNSNGLEMIKMQQNFLIQQQTMMIQQQQIFQQQLSQQQQLFQQQLSQQQQIFQQQIFVFNMKNSNKEIFLESKEQHNNNEKESDTFVISKKKN